MNKFAHYPALDVQSVSLHMGLADLILETGEVDTVQLLLSGDDDTVTGVHHELTDGTLHVDLPVRERVPNLIGMQWLQIVVRFPVAWRGSLTVHTTSGNISITGITGTDFRIESVSGNIKLANTHGMQVSLQSLSGPLLAEDLHADDFRLLGISGVIRLTGLEARHVHFSTVSANAECVFSTPFERFDGNSVSGSLRILTPMKSANAVLKTISGRILTNHFSIRESGPDLRFTTVTGNLEIEGSMPDTHASTEQDSQDKTNLEE